MIDLLAIVEELEDLLAKLVKRKFDAHVRHDKYAQHGRGHSSGAAREAWKEYQTLTEMVKHVNAAIVAADILAKK